MAKHKLQTLEDLKDELENIERQDDWAYDFITSLLIQKELEPERKLTKNQFKKLIELHNKYC